MPRGVMPWRTLYSSCLRRRRLVSSIARCMEPVTRSAYMIARGAPDGLDERVVRAQEPLLVRVQDRDQRDLRQVESLAQQVDPDQHVELAEAQIPDDLGALDGLDVGVEVAHPHVVLTEVVG